MRDNGEILICVENDQLMMEYIVATLNKFPQVRGDIEKTGGLLWEGQYEMALASKIRLKLLL